MFRKAKSVFRCVLASLYLSLLFSIRFINFSFPYYYYCYFPSSSLYHPCCHIYTLPQLLFHFHVCLQTNKLVNSLLYVFIKPDFLFRRRRLPSPLLPRVCRSSSIFFVVNFFCAERSRQRSSSYSAARSS